MGFSRSQKPSSELGVPPMTMETTRFRNGDFTENFGDVSCDPRHVGRKNKLWLVVSTPLEKNMKVSWEYYSQYMEKIKTWCCKAPASCLDLVSLLPFCAPVSADPGSPYRKDSSRNPELSKQGCVVHSSNGFWCFYPKKTNTLLTTLSMRF